MSKYQSQINQPNYLEHMAVQNESQINQPNYLEHMAVQNVLFA